MCLSVEVIKAVAQAFVEAENGIIVYGHEARSAGMAVVQDLAALATLAGKVGRANSGLIALLPGGNSRGALDMGLRPDKLPGDVTAQKPGLSARMMWQAAQANKLRAFWIAGLDPAAELAEARAALESAELVVVQDLFLTATGELADVVLPAASVAERDGTYTNAERRVQRSRQARPAVGMARPDWQIVQDVGIELADLVYAAASAALAKGGKKTATAVLEGPEWEYVTSGDVAAEIAAQVPGYNGITYHALAATGTGGHWGRQVNEAVYYDGTNYENTEGVGIQPQSALERGKAVAPLAPLPVAISGTDERAFTLLVQPLAYDGDPLLRGSKLQPRLAGAFVAVSKSDATRQNIQSGDRVRVASDTGETILSARVVADLPAGVVMVPAQVPGTGVAQVQTGPRTPVSVSKVVSG